MRVFVTGGSGLIGRSAISHLLESGHTVTVLDRIAGRFPSDLRVTQVTGNTLDHALLSQVMKDHDALLHLAAGASFLMYEQRPLQEYAAVVDGFHNVVEVACRERYQRVVFASTSAVYEGNPFPYHEYMEIDPPDLKALAKKHNEELAKLYSRRYSIPMIGLRPFSVYGDDESHKGLYANVVSLFVWALCSNRAPLVWGDGNQTRDFIHADDVGRACQLALEVTEAPADFLPVNVGTGVETSFVQVLELIAELVGIERFALKRNVEIPVDIYAVRLLADTRRAEDLLGGFVRISLREGISRVVNTVTSWGPDKLRQLADSQLGSLEIAHRISDGITSARAGRSNL